MAIFLYNGDLSAAYQMGSINTGSRELCLRTNWMSEEREGGNKREYEATFGENGRGEWVESAQGAALSQQERVRYVWKAVPTRWINDSHLCVVHEDQSTVARLPLWAKFSPHLFWRAEIGHWPTRGNLVIFTTQASKSRHLVSFWDEVFE